MDIPYPGLACTSFLYSACPPWWRVLTCPALRAAACQTASSADGSHMRLECQCPMWALRLQFRLAAQRLFKSF